MAQPSDFDTLSQPRRRLIGVDGATCLECGHLHTPQEPCNLTDPPPSPMMKLKKDVSAKN